MNGFKNTFLPTLNKHVLIELKKAGLERSVESCDSRKICDASVCRADVDFARKKLQL